MRRTTRTLIDVTVPRSRGPREGIDVHRVRRLDPLDVTTRDGIPVTTLARTLVDLCSVLSDHDLERTVRQAEILRLVDLTEMTAIPSAFEDDRVRDAELTLAGWTVVRVTWRRISREPDTVAAILRRLLEQRAAAPARRSSPRRPCRSWPRR